MDSFTTLLQQGTAHAWLFVPTAILLGALHGLEPGHSKTMMAAFIIAIRGTILQAVLLGLSAALSHTAVVWAVALGGQYLGRGVEAEAIEPYLQLASAVIIVAIALWMFWRTRQEEREAEAHEHHHHDDTPHQIDTGHGRLTLEIHEDGVPPRWRLRAESGAGWPADDVVLTTTRPDGTRQFFTFLALDGVLESREEIPEPHAFAARLSLGHAGHSHDYEFTFSEDDHSHSHSHGGLDLGDGEAMDAHARAHAQDISRRFGSAGSVTTGQIILFGLTGGLIPCPAAITVLLLCLQLKQLTLGVVLVACFSIGLAVTMVGAGVAASLSVHHVQKHWKGFSTFARRAPYASGALMLLIGLYMGVSGWMGLMHA
ncbi:nickel/cobalt efflux transporter [Pleomorphomonas oryzae]|uniref:nickel/cobalt efflux transporter n=1 Tax=Pleomorphomonas oryzae TaxID=261934 RepID=UPI000426CF75|nr:nickel/cobalt efflux transporter [Pleomorphomonas oryzae]